MGGMANEARGICSQPLHSTFSKNGGVRRKKQKGRGERGGGTGGKERQKEASTGDQKSLDISGKRIKGEERQEFTLRGDLFLERCYRGETRELVEHKILLSGSAKRTQRANGVISQSASKVV